MDILERSQYNNLIVDERYYSSYGEPVDPNTISGKGVSDPYFVDDPYTYSKPIFRYPDEEEQQYNPTEEKRIYDEQHNITTIQESKNNTNTNTNTNTNIGTKKQAPIINKSSEAGGYELKEFIKKPAVMGAGVLILGLLAWKFI